MDMSKGALEDSVCRICRCSEGGQILIFGGSGAERAIPDKINECLPIKVSMKDGLPQTICGECLIKLEDYFNFRELSRQSESKLSGMSSSASSKSDSDNSNYKTSDKEKDGSGSVECGGKKRDSFANLSEPLPEDYVLMKEETINVDNSYKTSNVMADYLIEFNNNNKIKAESDMADRDIVMAMRRRREVLPPMWDVFERVQSEQERQLDSKAKGSKQALRTLLKGKFSVIHRRYIIAKTAFPCSLCGRCFRFNQGQPRDGEEGGGSDVESCEDLYNCQHCGRQFQLLDELQNHELTHSAPPSAPATPLNTTAPAVAPDTPQSAAPTPSFPCTVCNKGFSRNEHLARHMLVHTGGRPFQCDICTKVFTRKEHLVRHRATHMGEDVTVPEEKPFVCELCNVAYARREQMVKHKKMIHNIEEPDSEPKPFVCDHCHKTFTRKEHLVRHKKIHLRDIPLTVNTPQVMRQVGKDTVTLEISSNMSDGGNGLSVNSLLEQGRYGDVSIERRGGAAPDDNDDSYYPAPESLTDEQRAQLEGFLDSSIGVEPELMGYDSDPMPIPLPRLLAPRVEYGVSLEKESIDLEDLKRMPKCRICAKAFTKKNHLNRHLKRYHNLTKEQVNSGKFEMYENGDARPLLETTTEDGEGEDLVDDDGAPILKRPKCAFPCSICRKTFTRKYHMYRHQKTQHGIEFPSRDQQKDEVKCSDCGLLFLSSEELNNHDCVDDMDMEREPARRKAASLGGTFKCAICKSFFESHEGFKDHECKKPHRCNTCGETFDKGRLLAKHMESHNATATITEPPTQTV